MHQGSRYNLIACNRLTVSEELRKLLALGCTASVHVYPLDSTNLVAKGKISGPFALVGREIACRTDPNYKNGFTCDLHLPGCNAMECQNSKWWHSKNNATDACRKCFLAVASIQHPSDVINELKGHKRTFRAIDPVRYGLRTWTCLSCKKKFGNNPVNRYVALRFNKKEMAFDDLFAAFV